VRNSGVTPVLTHSAVKDAGPRVATSIKRDIYTNNVFRPPICMIAKAAKGPQPTSYSALHTPRVFAAALTMV
jgi:hypothetical protein